jgi:hydroxypyruvate isomerase
MNNENKLTRRSALGLMAGAAAGAIAMSKNSAAAIVPGGPGDPLKGRLKQSVCKWCYPKMSLEELAKNGKEMGLLSVELLSENDWPVVKAQGLTVAVANGPSGIVEGWNKPADHDKLVKESERLIPLVAAAGIPNMIVFSGNRRGISDAEGLDNCAKGIKRIMALAEQQNVNVIMELLNSKVDHKDYQCDHTAWGVELVKRVGSPRFKLLYDIYHMQIMEGDVIRTIQQNIEHIAHFHTGGVPGRNEIDDSQELNYARIAQAIVDTGFKGYYAHEFIPKKDAMTSLTAATKLCDV